MAFTILVEVSPKGGSVSEKIFFKNIEGINHEEAIKKIQPIALDIAEDIKDFWECRVEVKYSIV